LTADAIRHFCPGAGDEERAHRLAIHKARDIGQARATRSRHARARAVYWLATQLAGDWIFRPASVEDLAEIRRGLGWLFLVAGLLQRLEASDD
jgi:hypothetical protein